MEEARETRGVGGNLSSSEIFIVMVADYEWSSCRT